MHASCECGNEGEYSVDQHRIDRLNGREKAFFLAD
jgi:hypothetical protein